LPARSHDRNASLQADIRATVNETTPKRNAAEHRNRL